MESSNGSRQISKITSFTDIEIKQVADSKHLVVKEGDQKKDAKDDTLAQETGNEPILSQDCRNVTKSQSQNY